MELQLKIRLLLLATITLTIASCEKDVILIQEEHSVNQRFDQSMEWNETHPYKEIVTSSDDYTILFMGDSHIGTTGNLNNFIRIADENNAQAIVMAGDLTTGSNNDCDKLEQCLQSKGSLLAFLTVGNHDLWPKTGWDEFYTRFGASVYYFTVKTPGGNDLYISLDSGSGTLGTSQLEWFESLLQNQRSDYRRCIVFTHLNFFRFRHTEISNPLVEELNKLIDIFTKYQVDMLVSGHEHKRSEEVFGITTYIVLEPLKDDTENAGYLDLKIKNGKITNSFERFNR